MKSAKRLANHKNKNTGTKGACNAWFRKPSADIFWPSFLPGTLPGGH